jgi:hypothetical protein
VLCRARGLEARIEEAAYLHLARRGRRRVRFTQGDWQARRDDFGRALTAILDGIAAGHFFPNPGPDTCRVCDYGMACGTERERVAWAAGKAQDPVRRPYERLQEIP